MKSEDVKFEPGEYTEMSGIAMRTLMDFELDRAASDKREQLESMRKEIGRFLSEPFLGGISKEPYRPRHPRSTCKRTVDYSRRVMKRTVPWDPEDLG
jgi:hypothetical protein